MTCDICDLLTLVLQRLRIGARLAVFLLSGLSWSSSFAQVYIGISVGLPTITDPISASYSTPYSQSTYGTEIDNVLVSPNVSASLASGTFYDSVSYRGSGRCPGCTGAYESVAMPFLEMQDYFMITSPDGTDIAWKLTLKSVVSVGVGQLNSVQESFGAGGNINESPATNGSLCFANDASRCPFGTGIVGANNIPYTIMLSGTVASGEFLTFAMSVNGESVQTLGPTATSFSDSMVVDPLIQLIVPTGTHVISASGVFPVTYSSPVPELPSAFLFFIGMLVLSGSTTGGIGRFRGSKP